MRLLLLLTLIAALTAQDYYSVEYNNYQYVLKKGKSPVSLAWGYYQHDVETDGWGKLYIWTSNTFNSHSYSLKTYFAAGYLEGSLTHKQIWEHQRSWKQFTFGEENYTQELQDYMVAQDKYTRDLIMQNPNDDYYKALARVTAQNDGLIKGQNDHADQDKILTWVEMQILQSCGDIYELKEAMKPKKERTQWHNLSGDILEWEREKTISCSALVSANDDWSDVIATHTTWSGYQNMLRIYKYYSFTGPKPYRVSFSAKPALIYSKDDFYLLPDSKLVLMETTNGILDSNLYDLINEKTLLTWQRVPIANQLSTNGKDWTSTFVRHNSGTYNNQYIVIDYKTFSKGQPPKSDFIWISETIPGFYKTQDVTQKVLQRGGYWPSYNIPYDQEIYEKAGFKAKFEQEGDKYSYDNCPRGKMFNRDAGKVKTLADMKKFIRQNDYKNDDFSNGDPANAIANRSDLRQTNPRPFGAIDAKVTNSEMLAKNQATIQNGPTYDQQPIFEWTSLYDNLIHLGQPKTFHFDWIVVEEPKQ